MYNNHNVIVCIQSFIFNTLHIKINVAYCMHDTIWPKNFEGNFFLYNHKNFRDLCCYASNTVWSQNVKITNSSSNTYTVLTMQFEFRWARTVEICA